MIVVLRKDLRLTLDALVPWCMVVGGLAVAAATAVRVDALRSLMPPAQVLIGEGAALMTLSLGAVTAWITASVLLGDRRHRAAALSAVLPVAGSTHRLTRLLSILAASSLPIGVCVLLQLLGVRASAVSGVVEPGRHWWVPIAMGLAGIGWGWLASLRSRRPYEVVAMSLLGGLASMGLAIAGVWTFDQWAIQPLVGTANGGLSLQQTIWAQASAVVPSIGLAFGGAVALVIAFRVPAVPRRPRSAVRVAAIVASLLVAPWAAGVATTGWMMSRYPQRERIDRERMLGEWVRQMSDERCAEIFQAWNAAGGDPTAPSNSSNSSNSTNQADASLRWLRDRDRAAVEGPDGLRTSVYEVLTLLGRREHLGPTLRAALASLSRLDSPWAALLTLDGRQAAKGLQRDEDRAIVLAAAQRYPTDWGIVSRANLALVQWWMSLRAAESADGTRELMAWATRWRPNSWESAVVFTMLCQRLSDDPSTPPGLRDELLAARKTIDVAWDLSAAHRTIAPMPDRRSGETSGEGHTGGLGGRAVDGGTPPAERAAPRALGTPEEGDTR